MLWVIVNPPPHEDKIDNCRVTLRKRLRMELAHLLSDSINFKTCTNPEQLGSRFSVNDSNRLEFYRLGFVSAKLMDQIVRLCAVFLTEGLRSVTGTDTVPTHRG